MYQLLALLGDGDAVVGWISASAIAKIVFKSNGFTNTMT